MLDFQAIAAMSIVFALGQVILLQLFANGLGYENITTRQLEGKIYKKSNIA